MDLLKRKKSEKSSLQVTAERGSREGAVTDGHMGVLSFRNTGRTDSNVRVSEYTLSGGGLAVEEYSTMLKSGEDAFIEVGKGQGHDNPYKAFIVSEEGSHEVSLVDFGGDAPPDPRDPYSHRYDMTSRIEASYNDDGIEGLEITFDLKAD